MDYNTLYMFDEVGERVKTKLNPLVVRKRMLDDAFDLRPRYDNPFIDYEHQPDVPAPVLSMTAGIRSVDLTRFDEKPMPVDGRVELSADFVALDPIRGMVEAALGQGFMSIQTTEEGVVRGVSAVVVLDSGDGGKFVISAYDSITTYGDLVRRVREARMRNEADSRSYFSQNFANAVDGFAHQHGEKQSARVYEGGSVSIIKFDAKGEMLVMAKYSRDGRADIEMVGKKRLNKAEIGGERLQRGKYLRAAVDDAYLATRPGFREVYVNIPSEQTTYTKAAAEQETNFMRELLNATVSMEKTEQKFKEEKSQFGLLGNQFGKGRAFRLGTQK